METRRLPTNPAARLKRQDRRPEPATKRPLPGARRCVVHPSLRRDTQTKVPDARCACTLHVWSACDWMADSAFTGFSVQAARSCTDIVSPRRTHYLLLHHVHVRKTRSSIEQPYAPLPDYMCRQSLVTRQKKARQMSENENYGSSAESVGCYRFR